MLSRFDSQADILQKSRALALLFLCAGPMFFLSGCETSTPIEPSAPAAIPRGAFQPAVTPPNSGTLKNHYESHYLESISQLNRVTADTPYPELLLVELVKLTHGKENEFEVYKHASDAWAHEFYWRSVRSDGGGKPSGKMLAGIERAFGSYEKFKEAFLQSAEQLQGSGWLWLIEENAVLKIMGTSNYEIPLEAGQKLLLVLDLWEHAYLDTYGSDRHAYAQDFLAHLVNWEFAEENYNKPA